MYDQLQLHSILHPSQSTSSSFGEEPFETDVEPEGSKVSFDNQLTQLMNEKEKNTCTI
jgi:hypothetical protein